MKDKYYVFGASGHAKVVVDIVFSNNIILEAVIDDNPQVESLMGVPVVHSKKFEVADDSKFIIAVGDNATRKEIVASNNFQFFKSIHIEATVSKFATLDEGTVVMAQAVVNADAKVGKHSIINTRSVVEHDCILEDYVHISPNASLAGNVFVGEGTQIGIGANVIQGIKIGKWVTIGAGAVIINNVPDYAVVVGNPGKIIKYKI